MEKIIKFINENSRLVTTYQEAIDVFYNLSKFLKKENLNLDYDMIIEILKKSKLFMYITELIFKKYSDQICAGYLERLFGNSVLKMTIEMYCLLNEITISERGNEFLKSKNANEDIYLQEIGKHPRLSQEESYELIERAQQGDIEARDKFIESNLRLVINVAKSKSGRGLSFLDAVQEGNLGLVQALYRFNTSMGYQFSTYATYWIKQSIDRATDHQASVIRIPSYLTERIRKTKRIKDSLRIKLHREPSYEEISNATGYKEENVIKYLNMDIEIISLDKSYGEDEDLQLINIVPSSDDTPEEEMINNTFRERLIGFLESSNIPLRYIEIIKLRFGIFNNYEYTLESIGEIYGITRERVRQIEKKALEAMRYDYRVVRFIDFINLTDSTKDKIRSRLEENHHFVEIKEEEHFIINKSIYSFFSTYNVQIINCIIAELDESDRAILNLCYGEDVRNPVFNYVTEKVENRFYNHLLPKMEEMLIDIKQDKLYKKTINFA